MYHCKTPRQYQGPCPTVPSSIPVHLTALSGLKQSRKKVRFQPSATVQPVDCSMTQEEKSRCYYSKEEMKVFSLEVETIQTRSKEMPSQASVCSANTSAQECIGGLEADLALRGLELRLCPIRVRNKILVQKSLLKHHRKLQPSSSKTPSEEKVLSMALKSARLTRWSRQVALETARIDSLRAYGGDYSIPINEPVDISPFPATTKRRRISFDEDSKPTTRVRS